MTNPDKSNYDASKGIRAMGESDRSPEYKAARNTFVDEINSFLAKIAEVRKSGNAIVLQNGTHFHVENEPRIKETFMGPLNPRVDTYVQTKQAGISLTGDGLTSPYSLQVVLPEGTTILVNGTNPLLPKNTDGEYTRKSRLDGDFASLVVNQSIASQDAVIDSTETYAVYGDGSVSSSVPTSGEPIVSWDERALDKMTTGVMVVNELATSWGVAPN